MTRAFLLCCFSFALALPACRSDLDAGPGGTDTDTAGTEGSTSSTGSTSGSATTTTGPGSSTGDTGTSSTTTTATTGGPTTPCDDAPELNGLGAPLASASTLSESDDFNTDCGGLGAGDRVYRWKAPAAGWYAFDTVGSDFDTVLSLLDTDCSTLIECNDDDVGVTTSRILREMAADEEVFIVVDGNGMAGAFELNIADAGCPSVALSGTLPIVQSDTLDGPQDLHENACGGAGEPDRGYTFTATEAGTYAFTATPEGGKEVSVSAYDGVSCGPDPLTCAVTAPFADVGVSRYLDAGATATFVVDGQGDTPTDYEVELALDTCPDETLSGPTFDHGVWLPGSHHSLGGALCGPSPGYGAHFISYTAEFGGFYWFDATSPDGTFRMYLLEGTGVCDGEETNCVDATDQGGTWTASIDRRLNGGEKFTVVLETLSPPGMVGTQVNFSVNVAIP